MAETTVNQATRRGRRLLGRILLALALALGVVIAWQAPQAFALTGLFQTLASQMLGAQVDSRYGGGAVLAKFRDSAGDDNGAGALSYPLHESFQTGHVLDLLAYAVRLPVVANLPFVPDRAYWQLDFTMGELGPAVIHDYIDLDGAAGGSTESANGGNEGVSFDPAHPWDLFVEVNVHEGTATLQEAGSEHSTPLSVYVNQARKNLMVRLPLDRPMTKSVLDGRTSWHYVLVGGWDDYARGHFLPVGANPSLRNGGGAESRQTPRVFDYLGSKEHPQSQVLASFDESSGAPALLYPIEVKPGQASDAGMDATQLAALEAGAKKEAEAAMAQRVAAAKADLALLGAQAEPSLKLAMDYWETDNPAKAEAIYDALIKADPANLEARARKGTLISSRCLTAKSLDETIGYVNQAFAQLDAALAGAEKLGMNSPSAVPWEAYGSLCLSIPEVPFGRSRSGAEAFKQAARWHEAAAAGNPDDPSQLPAMAGAYLMAGICFEKAQANAEAETCFLQAGSVKEMDGQTRLELAKRGFQ